MDCTQFVQACQRRINLQLANCLPKGQPYNLHQAMRYVVLSGGKRLRPILVYATGECFAVANTILDKIAVAIELLHIFSLVHDDLPALDNDDYRRGKLACHKAFDEATAILVGDALTMLAFQVLTECQLEPQILVTLVQTLAQLAGARGMIGGQDLDLHPQLTVPKITKMYVWKTGALFKAAVTMPVLAAKGTPAVVAHLAKFAAYLGLAFQIQDDLQDGGAYVTVLGVTKARKKIHTLRNQAAHELTWVSCDTKLLAALLDFITV